MTKTFSSIVNSGPMSGAGIGADNNTFNYNGTVTGSGAGATGSSGGAGGNGGSGGSGGSGGNSGNGGSGGSNGGSGGSGGSGGAGGNSGTGGIGGTNNGGSGGAGGSGGVGGNSGNGGTGGSNNGGSGGSGGTNGGSGGTGGSGNTGGGSGGPGGGNGNGGTSPNPYPKLLTPGHRRAGKDQMVFVWHKNTPLQSLVRPGSLVPIMDPIREPDQFVVFYPPTTWDADWFGSWYYMPVSYVGGGMTGKWGLCYYDGTRFTKNFGGGVGTVRVPFPDNIGDLGHNQGIYNIQGRKHVWGWLYAI